MRSREILALFALVFVIGLTGCAARKPHGGVSPLPSADLNGDGRVSYDEFLASLGPDLFARLDTDESGHLSCDEWKRFDATPEAQRNFEALDTNRDNQVSLDEWKHNLGSSGIVVHLFTRLDTNHDDSLSPDELQESPLAPVFAITF